MKTTKALSSTEAQRYDICKKTIRDNLDHIWDVAYALKEIREKEYYLVDYDNFENFCREEFKIGKSRAYQLLKAVEVKESVEEEQTNLSTAVDNERQARELAKVPEKKRAAVIKKAAKKGKVTAASIKETLDEVFDQPVDAHGTKIPPELLPTWKRRREIQDLMTAVSQVKVALQNAQKNRDVLFMERMNTVFIQEHVRNLETLHYQLHHLRPEVLCPGCGGTLKERGGKRCTLCHSIGFMCEEEWKRANKYTNHATTQGLSARVSP